MLSFKVDEATPENIRRLVIAALNIGAVVIADDQGVNFTVASTVGRTFRLVHLMSPHFNLPMRKGGSRSLSTILIRHLENFLYHGYGVSKSDGHSDKPQLGLFS